MTTDKRAVLQDCAMRYGTFMGIFWIIKFVFIPLGVSNPILHFLFILLTMFVPILGYIYARKFRNNYSDGTLSFIRAFTFLLFMYLFASILTALAHYIYFQYLDNGFLFETYRQQLETLKSVYPTDMLTSFDQLIQAFDTISSLTPLQLTFQLMSQNTFYGILLSLITALFVMKYKKNI